VARLSNYRSHHRCGYPVLRVGEKGEYDDGIRKGRCRTEKGCAGSIAAHPCEKRKDGAVEMVQCKDGPPAQVHAERASANLGHSSRQQKAPHNERHVVWATCRRRETSPHTETWETDWIMDLKRVQ
jgi:hypothetical protein